MQARTDARTRGLTTLARARLASRAVGSAAWPLVLTSVMLLPVPFAEAAEKGPPPEQAASLRTKDGVNLHCRFFATLQGKQGIPVILLHGWKGQSADLLNLALLLQKQHQCAVIVPDLRGHGSSTTRVVPGRSTPEEIRLDRLRPADIQAMIHFDVEAVKKFLLNKHNAGELNIELLCVVGAEIGTTVAANWAAFDWSWPQLPTYKQGQDVRLLVMISPPASFQGVRLQPALTRSPLAVRSSVSAMIVYGTGNASDGRSATQIHKLLERFHDPQKKDLELIPVASDLQGTGILNARGSNVMGQIGRFIERQMADARNMYPWRERVSPLGTD